MTMISRVGRRHASVRMLTCFMYALLIMGGATMVYPFLLMLAGSTKSGVDIKDVRWLPAFLVDDNALYRKHVESLFNEQLEIMRAVYDSDEPSFENVEPPRTVRRLYVEAWRAFAIEQSPPTSYTVGYMQASVSRTVPMFLRGFKKRVMRDYGNSIEAANRRLGTDFVGWNAFYLLPEDGYLRRSSPLDTPLGEAWRKYRSGLPDAYRYHFVLEGYYKALFLKTQFTRNIAEYNRVHGSQYASYDEIHLSERLPEGTEAERATWERFVRSSLNLEWIRADESARPVYEEYLRAKYGNMDKLNRQYGTTWSSWSDIQLPVTVPRSGLARSDWEQFVAGWKDPDSGILYEPAADQLRIEGIEELFRQSLRKTWVTVDAMNNALATDFAAWSDVVPPQKEAHYLAFVERRGEIRREFLTRNFIAALDHIAFHGRGVRNTVIYCLLAILSALIINPLAAYAMSRYKPPSAYKLLLFLLLTMAFPPMVTQIPVFLMMRDLNLLNTFAALLLPGLANGYSIFLLKGFFDALPRELYETASIDGAGEWTMFWHITMSLSKPILAVVALQAFTTAYSNFMFALLICQDEKMWTMMVWLYQLQMRSGPGIVYASLIIAAIPTLIIFIFCQNIILRGIVVPVEK